MTYKPLLMLFFALFVFQFGYSQCEYQFQPDPNEGIDATCHRTPVCAAGQVPRPCDTTNRGYSPHLYISSLRVGGVPEKKRAFLKFDFSQIGEVPSNCLPTKASMDLFFYRNSGSTDNDHRGTNAFYVERIVEDWTEDTIRWMYPASSFNLRMPATTTRDRIAVPSSATSTSDYSIDISKLVKFWFENPDSNFGMRFILQDENFSDTGHQVHLASSDYPDPNFRPRVNVTFPCSKANAGPDRFICIGDKAELSADGGESYEWTALNSGNDPLSNTSIKKPTITPSILSQEFQVLVKLGTCEYKDTLKITSETPGTASIIAPSTSPYKLCQGDSVELKASGGTVYKWSPSAGLSDPANFSTFSKPDSTTTYTVEVSNPGDKCPGKATIQIELNNQLNTVMNVYDTTICLGDSVFLEAKGVATKFDWTPETDVRSNRASSTWAFPTDTSKIVIESNAIGSCTDYDTVIVNVIQSIRADAGDDSTICLGESIQLSGKGDGTFVWNNSSSLNDAFIANPIASPTKTTTYTLSVGGTGSCTGDDDVTITVVNTPEITTNIQDTFICPADNIKLELTGATNVRWSTGEEINPILYQESELGKYVISVVGNEVGNGITCYSDTAYISITVGNCSDNEKISPPKFFSPNGDLINDKWVISDLKRFDENELQIFNRWGELIYQKKNYTNDWDGTYSGQNLPEDTYIWIITISFRGEAETYQGTVTILRDENSK